MTFYTCYSTRCFINFFLEQNRQGHSSQLHLHDVHSSTRSKGVCLVKLKVLCLPEHLGETSKQYLMVSNTIAGNATMKQLQREVLFHTKGQYMKESNTLEGNVTIRQQQKEIFCDTKVQYMKQSNNHAGNATMMQHQKEILLITRGHYMKELNNYVCNATIEQH